VVEEEEEECVGFCVEIVGRKRTTVVNTFQSTGCALPFELHRESESVCA
jgi:hypothetical protein